MMSYNISKLKMINGFDVERALSQFINHQAYYSALDKFVEEAKLYLCGYTTLVVIYSADIRKNFLADIEKIQHTLMSLGMIRLMSSLSNLTQAVKNESAEALSDSFLVFSSEINIMINEIIAARTNKTAAEKESKKPLILAVNNKPELLAAINELLSGCSTVKAAANAAAALKVLEKHTPALFLIDIEMPHTNDYELTKLIREQEQFTKTPVIVLAAKGTRRDVLTAMEYGVNDYIIKPVQQKSLLEKIRQYLNC